MIAEIILASANPLVHVVPHDLFQIKIGSLIIPVNNHMVMVGVTAVIMLAIFPRFLRNPKMIPVGSQNFIESICIYLRDEMAKPMLHEMTDRYICMLWTTFFFILISNLLGLLPINAILGFFFEGKLAEVGGTATGNIYVTGALATLMFFVIHISGFWKNALHEREKRSWPAALIIGLLMYFRKMVPPIEGKLGTLLFVPLLFLEMLSRVIQSSALALRLFANMIAGHLMLAVILLFIAMSKTLVAGLCVAVLSVAGCVGASMLELFVAFLQAYIFTFLATIFLGMAIHQEH
jgi:F-type H+-transporting ATPase subunit a